jgi:FkbM family methyltransferase
MKEHDGYYWPDADTIAATVIKEVQRLPLYLSHVPANRRALCVQAGGNVGVYADKLAGIFGQVWTFEPDPENFACLNRNLAASRVIYRHAALLNHNRTVTTERTEREANNYAASFVTEQAGGVPGVRIDDLRLPALDLLLLDTEGSEQMALEGAAQTIMRYSPVIAVELKGLGARYGVTDSQTEAWLAAFGYARVAEIGRDKVYRRK